MVSAEFLFSFCFVRARVMAFFADPENYSSADAKKRRTDANPRSQQAK
jgi:hypothetical protein